MMNDFMAVLGFGSTSSDPGETGTAAKVSKKKKKKKNKAQKNKKRPASSARDEATAAAKEHGSGVGAPLPSNKKTKRDPKKGKPVARDAMDFWSGFSVDNEEPNGVLEGRVGGVAHTPDWTGQVVQDSAGLCVEEGATGEEDREEDDQKDREQAWEEEGEEASEGDEVELEEEVEELEEDEEEEERAARGADDNGAGLISNQQEGVPAPLPVPSPSPSPSQVVVMKRPTIPPMLPSLHRVCGLGAPSMSKVARAAVVDTFVESAVRRVSNNVTVVKSRVEKPLLLDATATALSAGRRDRRRPRVAYCLPGVAKGNKPTRLSKLGLKWDDLQPVRNEWLNYAQSANSLVLSQVKSTPAKSTASAASGSGLAAVSAASAIKIGKHISTLDLHGCPVNVERCKRNRRAEGARGMMLLETQGTFQILTPTNKVFVCPKEGTVIVVPFGGRAVKVFGDTFRTAS